MREICVALLVVAVMVGIAGCATEDESTVSEPAVASDATPTVEPTATAEEVETQPDASDNTTIPPFEGPFTEESIYEFVAWMFSPYSSESGEFSVWKPTWLPEGFELAASGPEMGSDMDESVYLPSGAWLEWKRGDDLIHYVMAIGDYGDDSNLDIIEVDWGTKRGWLVRDDVYYLDAHGEEMRPCISVRSSLGPIQGIGVSEDDMRRVAASMVLVEPTETWEFSWSE